MKYQDNLESVVLEQYASALNSRAKTARAQGRLSVADLRDRILTSGGSCEWCGERLVNAEFELDHIISLKQGGGNSAKNLVIACPDCNRRKGQKHPARFAAEISANRRHRTALVERILRHYAMEPLEQASLFDQPANEAAMISEHNRDNAAEPRYRW